MRKRAKKRVAAAALQTRAEANRPAWARRHPAAAAAERRLRKDRARMLERWDHKNDGTPETHEHASRVNQGALARLCAAGAIDAHQLASAEAIRAVHERIGADVSIRTASLETRIDRSCAGEAFYERLGQVWREAAYTRWRAALPRLGARPKPGQAAAVLAMLGTGESGGPLPFTLAGRRWRMGNKRAKALLIEALDLWPRIFGEVRREIDPPALDALQAGISA